MVKESAKMIISFNLNKENNKETYLHGKFISMWI